MKYLVQLEANGKWHNVSREPEAEGIANQRLRFAKRNCSASNWRIVSTKDIALERKRAEIAAIEGQHGYCETAVNKAIAASNRAGRKIGAKEGRAIHALLKGRH